MHSEFFNSTRRDIDFFKNCWCPEKKMFIDNIRSSEYKQELKDRFKEIEESLKLFKTPSEWASENTKKTAHYYYTRLLGKYKGCWPIYYDVLEDAIAFYNQSTCSNKNQKSE